MPFPAPGLAATFEWWPIKKSELYIEGTINDLNAEPEKYAWDDALREKDFFYGLEVGYFWKRRIPSPSARSRPAYFFDNLELSQSKYSVIAFVTTTKLKFLLSVVSSRLSAIDSDAERLSYSLNKLKNKSESRKHPG